MGASWIPTRITCKHLQKSPADVFMQSDLSDAEASCTVNKQVVLVSLDCQRVSTQSARITNKTCTKQWQDMKVISSP